MLRATLWKHNVSNGLDLCSLRGALAGWWRNNVNYTNYAMLIMLITITLIMLFIFYKMKNVFLSPRALFKTNLTIFLPDCHWISVESQTPPQTARTISWLFKNWLEISFFCRTPPAGGLAFWWENLQGEVIYCSSTYNVIKSHPTPDISNFLLKVGGGVCHHGKLNFNVIIARFEKNAAELRGRWCFGSLYKLLERIDINWQCKFNCTKAV